MNRKFLMVVVLSLVLLGSLAVTASAQFKFLVFLPIARSDTNVQSSAADKPTMPTDDSDILLRPDAVPKGSEAMEEPIATVVWNGPGATGRNFGVTVDGVEIEVEVPDDVYPIQMMSVVCAPDTEYCPGNATVTLIDANNESMVVYVEKTGRMIIPTRPEEASPKALVNRFQFVTDATGIDRALVDGVEVPIETIKKGQVK